MGADIKQLRMRIKSVDSTLHLTTAMGLVASSKLRRAMENMMRGREYEEAVARAIAPLLTSPDCRRSPYLQKRDGEKLCLVVIAGDRGMAGGYNANIFRTLRDYDPCEIIPIGKRACDRFSSESVSVESFDCEQALGLAMTLCRGFADGEYDRVAILYTKYESMISQTASVRQIFPLEPPKKASAAGVVFEPDEETVLTRIIPEYVAGMLMRAARESFACEVASRRNAMDSAGKNAREMLDDLGLAYNRARQGAITQEITEIVAGSGN